jgi:hypothetical protein
MRSHENLHKISFFGRSQKRFGWTLGNQNELKLHSFIILESYENLVFNYLEIFEDVLATRLRY